MAAAVEEAAGGARKAVRWAVSVEGERGAGVMAAAAAERKAAGTGAVGPSAEGAWAAGDWRVAALAAEATDSEGMG